MEAILGSGALGEVWKAEDRLHDRQVAIKFLKSEVVASSPVLLRKFQQEARIGAVLGHPGIVRVDDFGEYDGRWYLVMEFLPGRNLQQEVDDHPHGLPVARLLSLGAQIADALAAAHARGIVHRDLKPANIMVTGPQQETAKICDFGIAHLAEATTVNTLTGHSAGTPVYMAPEQWLGQPVDARADLYALGGTLYTLLTGAPAFAGSLLVLKAQHLDTPPIPPDTLRPGLPTGLAPLLVQLLAKDPGDRPPSATQVAVRLRRLTEPGATTPTVTVGDLGAETVSPAPEAAVLTRPSSPEQATRDPEGTPPPAGGSTRRTVLVSLGATALFAPAVYLLSRTSTDRSRTGGERSPQAAATRPTGVPLTGHTDAVDSVAFSPDGRILASGSYDKTVRLWNVADRTSIGKPLIADFGQVYSVAFSPDGKILASGSQEGTIDLWNAAHRTHIGKPLPAVFAVDSVAFSPDGKILASGGDDIRLWNVAYRTPIGKPLTGHTDTVFSVAFSPDGKTLASGSRDAAIRLWRLRP